MWTEQKKLTQGLGAVGSGEGGRYMASEKQVSSSFISSTLRMEERSHITITSERHHYDITVTTP